MGEAISLRGDSQDIAPDLLRGAVCHRHLSTHLFGKAWWRSIGVPCTARKRLIDVRLEEDFAADPRFIPGSVQAGLTKPCRPGLPEFARCSAVSVICEKGQKLSEGALRLGYETPAHPPPRFFSAALLPAGRKQACRLSLKKQICRRADLQGGAQSGLRGNRAGRSPPHRPVAGSTALSIRRQCFFFAASSEVVGVAERFGGAPFDIEGVHWSHRGEMHFRRDEPRRVRTRNRVSALRLVALVRGVDTARSWISHLKLPGLLAASLGLSRMHFDDLERAAAGMTLWRRPLYRWAPRRERGETHNWPTTTPEKLSAPAAIRTKGDNMNPRSFLASGLPSECSRLVLAKAAQTDSTCGRHRSHPDGSCLRRRTCAWPPRSDLNVTRRAAIKPESFALGGWVAFEPMGDKAMMMGDLVLTASEINPVMGKLLVEGLQVTALHNHICCAPIRRRFYMHKFQGRAIRPQLRPTRSRRSGGK